MRRRTFLQHTATLAAGAGLASLGCRPGDETATDPASPRATPAAGPLFRISLAEWSLHKAIRGSELTNLDFPVVTRQEFGIDAVEYVNGLFDEMRTDAAYLAELKDRCDGEGVRSLLIMCDGEGSLGDPDEAARVEAVENHYRWVEAAAFLGCHSIRVNAASGGTREEQAERAADGLRRLCEFGDTMDIDVIVENHGGLSSDGSWLADVIRRVDHPRAGTLPDFGNFGVDGETWYDPYRGVGELMPYAKGVSAKAREFGDDGVGVSGQFEDVRVDYPRLMRIVLDAGYRGYVGIEYEGETLSEFDGIRATKALLEDIRTILAPEYE